MISPEEIHGHWDIGEVRTIEFVGNSPEKPVYKVTTSKGVFLIKSASPWESDDLLKTQHDLLVFLNKKGIPFVPKILVGRGGGTYCAIGGKRWFVMEYIRGAHPMDSTEWYGKLGSVIADLHRVEGFSTPTKYKVESIAKREIPKRAESLPFKEEFLKMAASLSFSDAMPQSVIHTDVSLGNAILSVSGQFFLVDWECAGFGDTYIDLANPFLRFTDDELVFRSDLSHAFYQAYFKKNKIKDANFEQIVDIGILLMMNYIHFGDVPLNWKRIQFVVEEKKRIVKGIKNAARGSAQGTMVSRHRSKG